MLVLVAAVVVAAAAALLVLVVLVVAPAALAAPAAALAARAARAPASKLATSGWPEPAEAEEPEAFSSQQQANSTLHATWQHHTYSSWWLW